MSDTVSGFYNNQVYQLPIANLAVTLNYTGTNVTSFVVVYQNITFTQTLTYTGGLLTNISEWIGS